MPVQSRHKAYLEQIGRDCLFSYVPGSQVTEEMIQDADIIIGNVNSGLLREPRRLKWLQLNAAGADNHCRPGVLRPGTILTNATGAYGLAISEHLLGMTLMLLKRLDQYYDNQKEQLWKDEGTVSTVYGSTTVVLGLGDIGSEYAARMRALGSYVIGIRRTPGPKPDCVDEICTVEQLDEVLPRADFAAMALPNTPQTYHIMDERRLRMMKRGAILVNAGRGTAIDQDALCRVLREGHLGGCGVDVTDPEPLPADHPLWSAPRMLITPHISGGYHMQETFERIVRIAGGNLEKFLAGRTDEMVNQVDFATGYRRRDG